MIPENWKELFPFFRQNRKLHYLDHAATTFMPDCVVTAWLRYHSEIGISSGRNRSYLGYSAANHMESARESIKDFFAAGEEYELAFSKNATESLNAVAWGIRRRVTQGDLILVSALEHHSNYLPWQRLAEETGAVLIEIPLIASGELDFSILESLAGQGVKVVSVTHTSNATGHCVDVARLSSFARKEGAIMVLDAAQSAGHQLVALSTLDVDFLAVSAHKMLGPKNIGGLLTRKSLCDELEPLLLGGGMVWSAGSGRPEWSAYPQKLEAGTIDPGLAGAWAESCRFLAELGWDTIRAHEERLARRLRDTLERNHRVRLVPAGVACSPAITSFTIDGIHSHDLETFLAERGIIIRTGHLCAQPTLRRTSLNSINRVSIGIGTTESDVDAFLDALATLPFDLLFPYEKSSYPL
ncbi:MAG: aminotransferase class V-fold PLP-dependent enzyme [Chlorobium sp.]|nr:aminotransferase class V-fold PLP-dependent enzyme [Chlorobium sp.]